MAYKFYNPNPVGRMTNDCSVRALSKALGITWDEAYLKLANQLYSMMNGR